MGAGRYSDRALYWTIGIVLVALLVAGVAIYRHRRESREATAKAEQLTREFRREGLPVPADSGSIASVLGTDGGPVCEKPTDPLVQAALNATLSNGAATVGIRPVIVDRIAVTGEELILSTYCPDQLPAFREYANENKFDNVVEE